MGIRLTFNQGLILVILLCGIYLYSRSASNLEHMTVPQSMTEFNEYARRLYTDGTVPTNLTVDGSLSSKSHLNVDGNISSKGMDFILGNNPDIRGSCGNCRALVKGVRDEKPELILNYGNDYPSGITLHGKTRLQNNRNMVRSIRLGNVGAPLWKTYWTLIECEAYNYAGVNVARGKPVVLLHGKADEGTVPQNGTNGKIYNGHHDLHDNYPHGFHGGHDQCQIQIDLGAEHELSTIVLYNRWNSSVDWRMDGTIIELLDQHGRLLRKIPTGIWHRQYSKEFLL